MSHTKGVENTMNDSQRLLTSMLVTTISLAGLSTLEIECIQIQFCMRI